MVTRISLPAILLFVFSTPLLASHDNSYRDEGRYHVAPLYEGTFHNDRSRGRATLETDSGSRYLLDFQGIDLYGAAERFDRDRAVVRGTLSYSRYSRFPVLVVDRITFHPYRGQSVTYRIRERHRDRWDRWDDGYPVRYERRYYYR